MSKIIVDKMSFSELQGIKSSVENELNKFVDTSNLFIIVQKDTEKPIYVVAKAEFYPQQIGGGHWTAYKDFFTHEFIVDNDSEYPTLDFKNHLAIPFCEIFDMPAYVRKDEIKGLISE